MHNFNTTNVISDSVVGTNMQIIDSALDSELYHRWVSADEMGDGGAAASPTYAIGSIGVYPPRWVLQDAASTILSAYVPRQQEWREGYLSLVVHYAASTTGDSFRWLYNIQPTTNLTAMSGTALESTESAPTVADAITTITFRSKALNDVSKVNGAHIGVMFSVGRAGGDKDDTNAGSIYIYGVDLVYNELKRVVGSK